ncbi:hypothetical protein Pmani_009631 [Petrolisthes manimaculis]|uniref:Uncharacterized protein n=1 Tax=Petrolisthes manimaculis TaxID=1843537 RepID=A0AAE1UGJ4_9EUCA|nr:hypothetical protein Pmani_009631 [Petrolisthes manimaculis]
MPRLFSSPTFHYWLFYTFILLDLSLLNSPGFPSPSSFVSSSSHPIVASTLHTPISAQTFITLHTRKRHLSLFLSHSLLLLLFFLQHVKSQRQGEEGMGGGAVPRHWTEDIVPSQGHHSCLRDESARVIGEPEQCYFHQQNELFTMDEAPRETVCVWHCEGRRQCPPCETGLWHPDANQSEGHSRALLACYFMWHRHPLNSEPHI